MSHELSTHLQPNIRTFLVTFPETFNTFGIDKHLTYYFRDINTLLLFNILFPFYSLLLEDLHWLNMLQMKINKCMVEFWSDIFGYEWHLLLCKSFTDR